MNAKGFIILLATVTVLTAVVFTWYNVQITREIPSTSLSHREKPQGLGATIYANSSNPVVNAAETNPLKGSVTNPFDAYQNPFDTK